MKNPTTKQIFEHLEYLGYIVEDTSIDEEADYLLAQSQTRANITVRVMGNHPVVIRSLFRISYSNDILTKEFLTELNKENARSVLIKAYLEENEEHNIILVVECAFIGYDKQTFIVIMDQLEKEVSAYLNTLRPFYQKEKAKDPADGPALSPYSPEQGDSQ